MGAGDSRGSTVNQTFSTGGTVYQAPVAHTQLVDGVINTNASITLSATDSNTPVQSLTYAVWSIPRNGTLVLSNGQTVTANHSYTIAPGGTLTYEPNPGYWGDDSFTFVACNEFACSSPVTVAVLLVPLTPAANPQSVSVTPPHQEHFTLTGSDVNSPALPLTYTVTVGPVHGTLSGTAPSLSYSPGTGFTSDTLQFVVNNGAVTSPPQTVTFQAP